MQKDRVECKQNVWYAKIMCGMQKKTVARKKYVRPKIVMGGFRLDSVSVTTMDRYTILKYRNWG